MKLRVPEEQQEAFHGYRYLLDATDNRQYAVLYNNGRPQANIGIFQGGGWGAFKPNETIFAFDDDGEFSQAPDGAKISVILFEIKTDAVGRPSGMKQQGCDYIAKAEADGEKVKITFELSPQSEKEIAERGFSGNVPKKFAATLNAAERGITLKEGRASIAPKLLRQIPFPPQHDGGALLARQMVEMRPLALPPKPAAVYPAKPPSPYSKVNDQTLAETKSLDGGEKLKIVFDFEARRVTEIFLNPGKATAMTGHSFAKHDPKALKNAYARLVELKGSPRPLKGKKHEAGR